MRDAMHALGGEPSPINPQLPVELVIDHSRAGGRLRRAAWRSSGTPSWSTPATASATSSCAGARARSPTPGSSRPSTGIVHQVNLEHLARVVEVRDGVAFPDTLVGTDSHTTMVNGLGVLGWGVGGIEAEAAMLGEPVSMLVPQVVGVRLFGELPEGATATDLVLTVTELLRQTGVVGKFVEFFGPGSQPRAGRPRDAGEHGARVRRHLRLLPGRRARRFATCA